MWKVTQVDNKGCDVWSDWLSTFTSSQENHVMRYTVGLGDLLMT